jgi:hypothetical protein
MAYTPVLLRWPQGFESGVRAMSGGYFAREGMLIAPAREVDAIFSLSGVA